LHGARSFRTRDVWEALKDRDHKQRKPEGYLQRASGVRSYWEDILVGLFGLHWRVLRESSSWASWKSYREKIVRHTCKRWDLPLCGVFGRSGDLQEPMSKKIRIDAECHKDCLVFRGDTPEIDEVMDSVAPLIHWCRPQRCFIYVVDSQSLQGVVCGQARLKDTNYEPIVARILERFIELYSCKWTPPGIWGDPVKWLDRSHNKVADGLADLDKASSWHKVFRSDVDVSERNLIVQSDGGLREGQCAAAAYIIGAWNAGTSAFEPLIAHGTYLDASISVFAAEAIALDEASAEACALIRRHTL